MRAKYTSVSHCIKYTSIQYSLRHEEGPYGPNGISIHFRLYSGVAYTHLRPYNGVVSLELKSSETLICHSHIAWRTSSPMPCGIAKSVKPSSHPNFDPVTIRDVIRKTTTNNVRNTTTQFMIKYVFTKGSVGI